MKLTKNKILNGSIDVTVKLLSCDIKKIMGSSYKNNFLQSRIKLQTIDSSSGFYIDRSFVHQVTLFF